MDTQISVAGNLTADPELRYTTTGAPVVNFTVAATSRTYDKTAGTWRDADTTFLRVAAWRHLAENTAESLQKGARVVVIGRLRQHTWEADDGTRRTGYDIDADEIAASLRFATATITRPTHKATNTGNNTGGNGPGAGSTTGPEAGDPWDTGTPAGPATSSPAGAAAPY
jgi:single-strand DNA-binding protein